MVRPWRGLIVPALGTSAIIASIVSSVVTVVVAVVSSAVVTPIPVSILPVPFVELLLEITEAATIFTLGYAGRRLCLRLVLLSTAGFQSLTRNVRQTSSVTGGFLNLDSSVLALDGHRGNCVSAWT